MRVLGIFFPSPPIPAVSVKRGSLESAKAHVSDGTSQGPRGSSARVLHVEGAIVESTAYASLCLPYTVFYEVVQTSSHPEC